MLDKIPRNRLLIYGMFLGILPLVIAVVHFFSQQEALDQLQSHIESVKNKAFIIDKKQAINRSVIDHYREADHFYIDKYLETLVFLEPEVENLQKLVGNKNFAFDDTVKKRLDFLINNNHLVLTEGVVQAYPQFQETLETLSHPVEVDVEDIQELLSRIEGINIGDFTPPANPPQLIILDFKIDRKSHNEKNETYNLNMKLLKREYL